MLKFEIKKKKLTKWGYSHYCLFLPSSIMSAYNWEKGESIKIVIMENEVVIRKRNTKGIPKKLCRNGYTVVLPAKIMKAYGWKEGENVSVIITPKKVTVRKNQQGE